MSSLPELRQSQTSMPGTQEFNQIREQAQVILASGFLPKSIARPEQAIAIALKGREIGIAMMMAFSHIHIVEGKPTISAELMLALIYRHCPSAQISFDQNDNNSCAIIAARSSKHAPSRFVFSVDDAQRAGVMNKSNWQKYPAAMLRARAISAMARAVFPDALMGCSYIPEELGAVVDEEGNVEVEPVQPQKEIRVVPAAQQAFVGQPAKAETTERLGDYVAKFGQFGPRGGKSGIKLSLIPRPELESYLKYLENGSLKKNEPLSGMFLEFYEAGRAYLQEQDLDNIPH